MIQQSGIEMKNVYDFTVATKTGHQQLSDYKDKVLLIVNTASRCGFTPQYQQLQTLYEQVGSDKFAVLAFPCNQFAKQEPLNDDEILTFCQTNYNVTFPVFAKINVNGKNSEPLFEFLKSECKGILGSTAIKWNFTKFLIDNTGKPIKRYAPMTSPSQILSDIQRGLGN